MRLGLLLHRFAQTRSPLPTVHRLCTQTGRQPLLLGSGAGIISSVVAPRHTPSGTLRSPPCGASGQLSGQTTYASPPRAERVSWALPVCREFFLCGMRRTESGTRRA